MTNQQTKTYTKKNGEQLIFTFDKTMNHAVISIIFPDDIKEDDIIAGKKYFVCGGGVSDMEKCFNANIAEDVLNQSK